MSYEICDCKDVDLLLIVKEQDALQQNERDEKLPQVKQGPLRFPTTLIGSGVFDLNTLKTVRSDLDVLHQSCTCLTSSRRLLQ
jgi:hypothetical protein